MPMPAMTQVPVSRGGAMLIALATLCLFAAVGAAHAQTEPPANDAPPAQAQPAPQPQPSAPSIGGGGLFEKLGDLLRDSAEGVSSGLKGTQQRIDDINKGTL